MRDLGGPTTDEVATQVDDLVYSKLKGKEKVGEPSGPVAFSRGTSSSRPIVDEPDATYQGAKTIREPLGMMAPEILAPTESIPIPSVGGGIELRHPDPDSEDPATDLNTRGRQSGKRRALFSPGHPAPKIPRVVTYVDSSSGDEGDAGVEQTMTRTPPRDQVVYGVLKPELSLEIVRSVGERSWIVQDLSRRLRFLHNELNSIVVDGRVSNCSLSDSKWEINQVL
ncbi:hypothetical protein LWI29_011995 [Acer saccharum]|uniref:Uncharacterized protein n=1 Tax=Acer saccharum TaxID=4024 RepID=A0AA39SSM7_ACESA|nr:hypothetical protein LWI29_011995 [Acer saccharum]